MTLAFPARPRKRWPLPCSLTRHGTSSRETFLRLLAQRGRQFWGRFLMCEKTIPAVLRGGRGNPTNGSSLSPQRYRGGPRFFLFELFMIPSVSRSYRDPSLRSGCCIKIRSGCFKKLCLILVSFLCFASLSCSHPVEPDTIVLIIEFGPSNL